MAKEPDPMILYHFPTSPFSRRVRLVLAHKGLSADLRDIRANTETRDDALRLNPLHTVPVLVDGARVVNDSAAIGHYLDRKVPTPPLWPSGLDGADAFELAALTDSVIKILSDLGIRYHSLTASPAFPTVRAEMVGRVERALGELADRVQARGAPGVPLCGDRWSAADIAVYTTVSWLEGLPGRAATVPAARQIVDLRWSLPAVLSTWADAHRRREDVVALG